MVRRNSSKIFFPVIIFFVLLNAIFIAGKSFFDDKGFDRDVLFIGNLLLFLITILSLFMGKRGLNNPNPHAFVRSVYGSIMIKLFLCIIVALIYIAIYQKQLNKPALFTCMGLYLVYTFMEVSILMKMLKHKEP
jgi:hypothetical protein